MKTIQRYLNADKGYRARTMPRRLTLVYAFLISLVIIGLAQNRLWAKNLPTEPQSVVPVQVANTVNAPAEDCTGDGIYLYEHADFQGACRKFTADHPNLAELGFDGVASSIRFVGSFKPYLYRATLCDDPNYGGMCSPFTTDDNDLGNNYIEHDRTSSLHIENIDYGDSLRIATFNVQFLPTEFVHDGCCEDIANRSRKIAERILEGDYDVIMLNEAFIDEIQNGLTQTIKEYYPYYVKKVHDNDLFDQDSGLMLLSRFPFEPLNPPYKAEHLIAYNGPNGAWHDVAYREYENEEFLCYTCPTIVNPQTGEVIRKPPYYTDACGGDDCRADKGIVYVRIRNPRSQQIYSFAFTHLNAASGPGDTDEIRLAQFGIAERVIRSQLAGDKVSQEHLFFLGDLNVNGDIQNRENITWTKIFNTPGNFFTDILTDTWHFRQTALPDHLDQFRDRGLTSNTPRIYNADTNDDYDKDDTDRIDYLLYNYANVPADKKLCIQHITVAYNLRHGYPYRDGVFARSGFQYLSDHEGVNADINLWAERCSPDEAYVVNPTPDTAVSGNITHPGSMQWYRIDPTTKTVGNQMQFVNGTYSIYIQGEPTVDFQVFESSNLSSPLPRRGSRENSSTWTFTVPEQPFFIRVFANDRRWTGDYKLFIHKHAGTYQDEAIDLPPNQPHLLEVSQQLVDSGRSLWFQLDTQAPHSGAAQNLRFFALFANFANDNSLFGDALVELRAIDNSIIISRTNEIRQLDVNLNNRQLYMVVTFRTANLYQIGWETNLKVLHGSLEQPLLLAAPNPTEGGLGDDDEISTLKIHADDVLVVDTGSLGHFDDNQIRGLEDVMGSIAFLQDLRFELVESDDGLNPDDHMYAGVQPTGIIAPHNYPQISIAGDGGRYTFSFTLNPGLTSAFPREPFVTDLAVNIVSQAGSAVAGGKLTYLLKVPNTGAGRATGVTLSLSLPRGVTFDPVLSNPTCTATNSIVQCNIGVIASAASVSVPIVVSVDPTLEERDKLLSTISVQADQLDTDPVNNTFSQETEILRGSDLSLSLSPLSSLIFPGAPLTYSITISNSGESMATGVLLTDTLPTGAIFNAGASSPGCLSVETVVRCDLGTLLDKESKTVIVAGSVASALAGWTVLTNTVTVEANEPDPYFANNMATDLTRVAGSIYLPIIAHQVAPDLIVKEIIATQEELQVVLQNIGTAPVRSASGFWVDVYINPLVAPTTVNQVWPDVAPFGLVWGGVLAGVELAPGAEMVLHSGDTYCFASHSSYPEEILAGSIIYAHVDSANANTDWGVVLERHEERGEPYNNIASITINEPLLTMNWLQAVPSSANSYGQIETTVPRK